MRKEDVHKPIGNAGRKDSGNRLMDVWVWGCARKKRGLVKPWKCEWTFCGASSGPGKGRREAGDGLR